MVMHRLRSVVREYPVETGLLLWVTLMIGLGATFTSCYTGNPPTTCNPADFGCTRPFGASADAGTDG